MCRSVARSAETEPFLERLDVIARGARPRALPALEPDDHLTAESAVQLLDVGEVDERRAVSPGRTEGKRRV